MARPASSSRLFLRGKIFYFRLCLKSPFPEIFNKTEIRISTGSPYRSVALKFACAIEIFMHELLNRLSKGEAISNLSNNDLVNYARVYYAENIEVINVLSLYKSFDDDTIKEIRDQKNKVLQMLRTNNYEEISSDVDIFVSKHCPNISKNCFDYLKISNAIAKAMLDLTHISESRAMLDFESEEKMLSKYETQSLNSGGSVLEFNSQLSCFNDSVSLMRKGIKEIAIDDAISEYIKRMEIKENSKEKSHIDILSRLKWLAFILGADKLVSDIEYVDMINFVKILKMMPARRAIKKQFRDKTLDELLGMDISDADKLSVGTINTIIEAVSTFFSDCVLNKHMEQNLAVNISVKDDVSDDERRDKFESEDICMIFDEVKRSAPTFKHDWEYWIFMLAMFSGARITEICQLHVEEDIRQIEGVWCLDINKNVSSKKDAIQKELKNNSSKRIIPIHPTLISLGFIDFVQERKQTNKAMLFSGITKIQKRNLGDKPSDFANKLINDAGVVSTKKVFHSFRHTFKHLLKTAKVNDECRNNLCGHEYKSSGCPNYETKASVSDLYDAICTIEFDYDFDSINYHIIKNSMRSRKKKSK